MEILLKTFLFDSLETNPDMIDSKVNAWVRETGSMITTIEVSHYSGSGLGIYTMVSITYLSSSTMSEGLPDFDAMMESENVLDLSQYDASRREEPDDQPA